MGSLQCQVTSIPFHSKAQCRTGTTKSGTAAHRSHKLMLLLLSSLLWIMATIGPLTFYSNSLSVFFAYSKQVIGCLQLISFKILCNVQKLSLPDSLDMSSNFFYVEHRDVYRAAFRHGSTFYLRPDLDEIGHNSYPVTISEHLWQYSDPINRPSRDSCWNKYWTDTVTYKNLHK